MKFFIRKLGIDLGTTNTLLFIPGRGIVLNEPSVIAVSVDENKILAVGNEAKIMVGKTPETIVAYQPMKDGVIADYRVTQAMLRYFINKAIGKWNFFKPEILISVPASVTSTEKRAVVEAAQKAGASKAYVIKEPILAAIGAGIPIQEPRGHMIVDIGGGTTDAAIISLGGIVVSKSVKVAGNKLDQAIADYIKKNFNLAIGEQTAEEIKISIGSALKIDKEETRAIKGRDFVLGLPRTLAITTNEVVRAIDNELKEIVKVIKEVLQDAPPELASDIIDQGIILTGGTSLLRNIDRLIAESTGVKTYLADEPLFSVAKGTGIALDHLDVYKKSIVAKHYN
ncbi:MAG: rod shape-determining protein [Candidatus Niyogibacteria bacterium RIFCSPLOWO2_12_FULL_41_13]|uniref:Cell shape-determining protein MreB n=1 Tax=Candidatus Niyogibacteria bacterium RIFCSPLOWO2_12_FULL_41_13 TaxID=1801726 RepID=A0A1G2F226_9BACT|nr:MAG: rod shape-determining protein [Candidatus Niyogibacteria bacterium RIFCSPLOWO2_12_FULL_41_13]